MGSKNRHAKHIIPIMMEHYKDGMLYIETCVGGANLFDKVDVPVHLKYGVDIHHHLIEMWKAVSKGWLPPNNITEQDYYNIKNNLDEDPALSGYVGFALSYSGKWWGGWCRGSNNKGEPRNYVDEAYRNALNQFPKLVGSNFIERDIFDIRDINKESLIYVDPPYRNTTKYKNSFDHDKFYDWCREKKSEGHTIFVSEYSMPDDFKCVWSKEVNNSLTKDTGAKKGTEKLYTL